MPILVYMDNDTAANLMAVGDKPCQEALKRATCVPPPGPPAAAIPSAKTNRTERAIKIVR